MNGLVVLAACVCASSGQLLASPRAINPVQSSQFHAQDEFGQFSYGYAGGPSSKTESRDAYGVTSGSWQYLDANGIVQTVNYIADQAGFRVAGTNLPVAPVANLAPAVAPVVAPLVGPAPVADTPEVAAAKAEFFAAYAAAEEAAPVERKRRSVIAAPALAGAYGALPYPYAAGILAAAPANIINNVVPAAINGVTYAAAPAAVAVNAAPVVAYNAAPAAAVVASAPAAREAVLTTVKLNPGHAVSYRVD